MQQNIQDLRSKLFTVMDDLINGKIDVQKAKTINETAQVLVNTAKVEVSFMRLNGGNYKGTGFIPQENGQPQLGEQKNLEDKQQEA